MQEIPWPLTKKKSVKIVFKICSSKLYNFLCPLHACGWKATEVKHWDGDEITEPEVLTQDFLGKLLFSGGASSIFLVRLGCCYIFILKRWTSGLWNIANKSGAGFRLVQNDAAALLPTPAPKDQVRLWHCSTALRIASNLNYKALADTPRGTLLWMLRLRRRSGLVSWLFSIIKRCLVAVKRCRRWLSSCCWGQSPCPPWDRSVRLLQCRWRWPYKVPADGAPEHGMASRGFEGLWSFWGFCAPNGCSVQRCHSAALSASPPEECRCRLAILEAFCIILH